MQNFIKIKFSADLISNCIDFFDFFFFHNDIHAAQGREFRKLHKGRALKGTGNCHP